MSQGPRIAVIGQSHVQALRRGMGGDGRLAVVDTNGLTPSWLGEDGRVTEAFLAGYPRDMACVSMVGGNFHTSFGLVEHARRFDFFCPFSAEASVEAGREIIPFGLVATCFRRVLGASMFGPMTQLRGHFTGAMVHVGSPPMLPPAWHVERHPNLFGGKLANGVAPQGIRQKLYDLHTALVMEHCAAIGARFLPPPEEALDAQGRLLERYWADDPSHGNAAYGALVHRQLVEALGL
jgi:hypothetical protein